ncbi:MAG: 2-oxoisovalerate dehydrogenase [Candidatus Firestonebacteria bacterium]|nr:2-oxoisovalerate dehydrogenase [Candidatus Firestonebacteria bacterium]
MTIRTYRNSNKNEIIFLIEEDPEGGYNAQAIGESIFTQGDTISELKHNIKEALSCHFESEKDIPNIIRLHFVNEEILSYA